MTKKERLEAMIAYYSDNKPTGFAKFLGVAPSTVSSWLARNTIDYDLIFSKCADINAEWLLTGKGEMCKRRELISTQSSAGIPFIPVDAIVGALTEERVFNANEYERYIIPNFREADFLITIFGDSMFPKYCSGDIIACQRLPLNHLFFQWNRAYVLETRQGVIVKRIKKGSDNEHILLVSDNPAYEPFELPVSEINVVALVVGIIRKE